MRPAPHPFNRSRSIRGLAAGIARASLVIAFGLAVASASSIAVAFEFRSIAANGTILYDAPSDKARKLYIASVNYPVEIIQTDGAWSRVRDFAGDLAWVEQKSLVTRRTVLVVVAAIEAKQKADERAPTSFRAQQGVVLDLVDATTSGWLRVRHNDGSIGFVRLREVWGY